MNDELPLSSAPSRLQRLPWELDWNLLRTFLVVVEEKGSPPPQTGCA